MIYLDNGATSLHKPPQVALAVARALRRCGNPGRGGYPAAMAAAELVLQCRECAGRLFSCQPEQVVFTMNCTHALNIAINTLIKPGSRVVISGFEHNAVVRPLAARGANMVIAGRKLFDWQDTVCAFREALETGVDAAVFTSVSNVFGYILPVKALAAMCRERGIPFIIDAAQGAGAMPLSLQELGADFIAMPGHKGLLGPQGTGLLLCGGLPEPLMQGGTGSLSESFQMPDYLPDLAEAGTVNVPGIAGLLAGMQYVEAAGPAHLLAREQRETARLSKKLKSMGFSVFSGENQGGTLSFVPKIDCEEMAARLAGSGICVRAGLHCAPLAHQSAGTFQTGTVRVSYGHDAAPAQTAALVRALENCKKF